MSFQNCQFCILMLPVLCLLCCTSGRREQSAAAKEFTVIFGSGGGFTGMAGGYIIHSDGKIEKWSGLYFRRDKIEPFGAAAPGALQPVQQVFQDGTFQQWEFRDAGNMTTNVWCISGQDTTIVSWNGLEPGPEVPSPIREFYGHLLNAVQSAQNR